MPLEVAFASLVIFCAFTVESIFGFGGGLIAIPLLSLFIPPADAILLVLIFQFLKIILLVQIYKKISFSALSLLPLGLVIGLVISIMLLDYVNQSMLRLVIGVYVIWFSSKDYLLPKTQPFITLTQKQASILSGLSGGFVQGLIGTGGPPFVVYLRSLNLDKEIFRATVMAVLFAANLGRVAFEWPDIISSEWIKMLIIPCSLAFVVSITLGAKMPQIIPDQIFNHIINGILFCSGLMLLVKVFL